MTVTCFKFYFSTSLSSASMLKMLIGRNLRAQYCQFQEFSKYPHKTPSEPRPTFCNLGPFLIKKDRSWDYLTQPLSSATSLLSAILIACFFKMLLILHSAFSPKCCQHRLISAGQEKVPQGLCSATVFLTYSWRKLYARITRLTSAPQINDELHSFYFLLLLVRNHQSFLLKPPLQPQQE